MDLGSHLFRLKLNWGKRSRTPGFSDQLCWAKQQQHVAHLRVSQLGVVHLGHKVAGHVLQVLLGLVFITPGTGEDSLILHISLPHPSPLPAHGNYSSHQGTERVTLLLSLVEDLLIPIYIKEGHLGRSGKALATCFHLSLSQTRLSREKE